MERDLMKQIISQLNQKRKYGLSQKQHMSLTTILRSIWFRHYFAKRRDAQCTCAYKNQEVNVHDMCINK
jgi:hypothetical protein